MEDRFKAFKGGPRRAASHHEATPRLMRRPLKTLALVPPDYHIPSYVLLERNIEKEVKFAGVVPDIPRYLDATNRTDVLRVIDRGKRERKIPWRLNLDHDAIFSLSIHNIKISNRDGEEEVQLRLAIHQVEAMCYIKDDDHYVLGIKFDDPDYRDELDNGDTCQMAVLYCDSRGSAEELCSLISQCFQLVYTEATIQFLDSKVNEGAGDMSSLSSNTIISERSYSKSTSKLHEIPTKNLGFLSQSSLDLNSAAAGGGTNGGGVHNNGVSTLSSGTSRSLPRRSSTTTNKSGASGDGGTVGTSTVSEQLLQDYMTKLYNKLNPEELYRFAMLVKAWHSSMPFREFCDKVLEIYGPDRKHLLYGMRPFIPEKDSVYFESFLERLGLTTASSAVTPLGAAGGHGTTGTHSSGFGSRVYRHSFHTAGSNPMTSLGNTNNVISGTQSMIVNGPLMGTGTGLPGTVSGIEIYDRDISDIAKEIENLGSNPELSGADPEVDYLPKTT